MPSLAARNHIHIDTMREDVSRLKAALREDWGPTVANALVERRKSLLGALEYCFAAGRNAECSWIEWLDREALSAYTQLSPCVQQLEDAQNGN